MTALARRLAPVLDPGWPSLDLAAVLTFLMFVYYAGEPGFPFLVMAPLSVALLMAGILWPGLRRSPWLWLYIAVAVVWARLPELLVMDNHHWLIAYWCISVVSCLAAAPRAPEPLVARNARLLLGLAMAFAVVQKLRTGEFVNGDFFEFLLLAGDRFEAFSEIVLRVPAADLAANRAALASLLTPGASAELVTEVQLSGPGHLRAAAIALSVWTLAIEGAIAVAFLWPGRKPALRAVRNGALLLFAVSTYSIATVGGFAWILMILGVAQCEPEDRLARFGYAAVFLLVLVYTLPWGDWLRAWG